MRLKNDESFHLLYSTASPEVADSGLRPREKPCYVEDDPSRAHTKRQTNAGSPLIHVGDAAKQWANIGTTSGPEVAHTMLDLWM